MALTILTVWVVVAVVVAAFFAAVGRSGRREDRALGYLPGQECRDRPDGGRETPIAATVDSPESR